MKINILSFVSTLETNKGEGKGFDFIGHYSLLVVFDGVKEAEVGGIGGYDNCIGNCPLCCSQGDEGVDGLEVVVEGDDVGV